MCDMMESIKISHLNFSPTKYPAVKRSFMMFAYELICDIDLSCLSIQLISVNSEIETNLDLNIIQLTMAVASSSKSLPARLFKDTCILPIIFPSITTSLKGNHILYNNICLHNRFVMNTNQVITFSIFCFKQLLKSQLAQLFLANPLM